MNWGYAACDAGLRSYYEPTLPPPNGWIYPESRR